MNSSFTGPDLDYPDIIFGKVDNDLFHQAINSNNRCYQEELNQGLIESFQNRP